jgi:hypothetical protein
VKRLVKSNPVSALKGHKPLLRPFRAENITKSVQTFHVWLLSDCRLRGAGLIYQTVF